MSASRAPSSPPTLETSRKILLVDDDPLIRSGLMRLLTDLGYMCTDAEDAWAARDCMRSNRFDLILCDIQMPGESGLDFLRQVAHERVDTAIVMVTGIDDPDVARMAIDMGAFGYVVKPFQPNEIVINVINAIARLDLERTRRIRDHELQAKLIDRTASLEKAIKRLEKYETSEGEPWHETLDRLAGALTLRDEETGRHIERVGLYSELLAEKSGSSAISPRDIRHASTLHDVGKIGVPDAILTKPGTLNFSEREQVKRHAELGSRLLRGSKSALLDLAATIALTHHERWDGTGYPRGLVGEAIPIEGRIVAIADVFDALTSERVYRPALSLDEALSTMSVERGHQFDPGLLDVFLGSIQEFVDIRESHPDVGMDDVERIRVLIVDDQELFAEGMINLLGGIKGITVTGRASSVEESIDLTRLHEPEVVLTDWQLRDGTAADLARSVLRTQPATKIVVLTAVVDDGLLAQAIGAGCSSTLTKDSAFEEIASAIRAAHSGEVTISLSKLSSVITRLRTPERKPGADLTPRELDVLARLGEGLSNEAIAEQLSLSVHTVRNHVQRIIMKLDAHSKLEAVARALREGLIEVPPRFGGI